VERPKNSNLEYDKVFATRIQDRSQKVSAPEPLVPSQRFATPADAIKEFSLRRDKTIAYVKTTNDDLRTHVGKGPTPVPMDAFQFLVLLANHSARHTAQIREVEANAGYPKAAARIRFLATLTLAHGTPDQLTAPQRATLQQHAAYLKSLADKGIITWAGHADDPAHPRGFVELEVATVAEAKALVENDPAVKAGIFLCTVEPFTEVLRNNNL
jgi:uncharacterized protein YciI